MKVEETTNSEEPMLVHNSYKCKHCGKIVKRESDKQWISSYCDETGKNARLILIKI